MISIQVVVLARLIHRGLDFGLADVANGTVDFWTLGDIHAGRGRRYHLVIIDEAAFAGPDMMKIWSEAIKPTLLDTLGQCIVASNTYGNDPEQFFWKICNEKKYRFSGFHAPTSSDNPFSLRKKIEDLRKTEHPLVGKPPQLNAAACEFSQRVPTNSGRSRIFFPLLFPWVALIPPASMRGIYIKQVAGN